MKQQPLFTERTREFCQYTGVVGIIMSVISIIHYFIAAEELNWFVLVLILPNTCSLISFFFLIKLNRWIIFMLGVCLFLFILYIFFVLIMLRYFVVIFSPSSILLFVYILGIFLYTFTTDLHVKLKENEEALKADADYWNGKI